MRLAARARPTSAGTSRINGQVRARAPDGDAIERVEDALGAAAGALIDAGRIGEAVAEHPVAGVERRPDHALDVVGARGREKHRLALDAELLGRPGKQQSPDRFGGRRAARLAGQGYVVPGRLQPLGKPPDLGRFAGPLAALEGDELAGHVGVDTGERRGLPPAEQQLLEPVQRALGHGADADVVRGIDRRLAQHVLAEGDAQRADLLPASTGAGTGP